MAMSGMEESEKLSVDGRQGICSRNCMVGSVTGVALSSLAMFIVFWCTNIFRDAILSSLEIRNGTSMFDWWQRPPVRAVYRIRIFNYTNVEEFMSGRAKKLKITEAGPYMYRETLTRVHPVMNGDGTVTYQENRSFQWEGGSPDDETVTVPNVPLLSAMAFTRDMSFIAQVSLTAFLSTYQAKTFIQVPAGGFLWGYDDEIFDFAKPFLALQGNVPFDKFGVLAVVSNFCRLFLTIDFFSLNFVLALNLYILVFLYCIFSWL